MRRCLWVGLAVIFSGCVAPRVVDDEVETLEEESVRVDVLENDEGVEHFRTDAPGLESPAHGTVLRTGPRELTYVPDTNFEGIDTFEYSASNAHGESTGRVTVTVLGDSPPVRITEVPLSPLAEGVVAADFDGDGKGDLVVRHGNEELTFALQREGSGGARFETEQLDVPFDVSGVGPRYRSPVVADFDGDGRPDIGHLRVERAEVAFFLSRERNGGIDWEVVTWPLEPSHTDLIVSGDFDGDGRVDIAVSAGVWDGVYVLFNDTSDAGELAFSERVQVWEAEAAEIEARSDEGGFGDVLVAAFGSSRDYRRQLARFPTVRSPAVEDLQRAPFGCLSPQGNLDADAELETICPEGNYFVVWPLGEDQRTRSHAYRVGALRFADLDGDGSDELVGSGFDTVQFWVPQRDVEASLRWEGDLATEGAVRSIEVAQLDGQGGEEILLLSNGPTHPEGNLLQLISVCGTGCE